jgi:hypothetical protein
MGFISPIGFITYEKKATILEKRANHYRITHDRIRRVKKKDGEEYFQFWRSGEKIPSLDNSFVYPSNNDKGSEVLLYSENRGEYAPCKIGVEKTTITIKSKTGKTKEIPIGSVSTKSESMKLWFVNRHKVAMARWKKESTLAKFIPIMMIMIFAIGCFLILMQQEKIAKVNSDSYNSLATLNKEMFNTMERMRVTTTAGSTTPNTVDDSTSPPPPPR